MDQSCSYEKHRLLWHENISHWIKQHLLIFWIPINNQKHMTNIEYSNKKFTLSRIQQFVHQQHQKKMSNLNDYFCILSTCKGLQQPGDLLDCKISTRFYPPLCSNNHKLLCPDNFHGPTHLQTNLHKKTYGEKWKCISPFSVTTWGKRHYIQKTMFNQTHERLSHVPILLPYEHI